VRGARRGLNGRERPRTTAQWPKLEEAVAMAKRLRRANPVTGQRPSLRKIAEELAAAGHVHERGCPYNAMSILRHA